jgi:hypothetical protein
VLAGEAAGVDRGAVPELGTEPFAPAPPEFVGALLLLGDGV